MLARKRAAITGHQVRNLNRNGRDIGATGFIRYFHQRSNVQTPNAGVRVVGGRGAVTRHNGLEIIDKSQQLTWIDRGVLHKCHWLSITWNVVQQRLASLAQFPRRCNGCGREIALHCGARNNRG